MAIPKLTRSLQIGFVLILLVATAQVVWWIWDQTATSRKHSAQVLALYEDQISAANGMLQDGISRDRVAALYPDLSVEQGATRLRPERRLEMEAQASSRVNRYLWEGLFFLAVLVTGIVISWRAIRREAELRQWQQDFIAAVSHELKSPLAGLQLTAQTMSKRPMTEPDRKRWVDRILSDTQRLSSMIFNVLDTTRLERGEVALQPESLQLERAVTRVQQDLAARAEQAGVDLKVSVDPQLDIHADSEAVHTVVRNLVENGIHATAAQQAGHVSVSARAHDSMVEMTVTDDGIGFKPDEAEQIFERFYRTGRELRRATPGTGLGLSIVKQYVDRSGGQVVARSDGKGQGATFTVRWPAADRGASE